jgi:hypothetical protein
MTDPLDSTEEGIDPPPLCPRCGSANVAWILRGYPKFSDELEADLASGSVVLGGCVVWPDQATHECNACRLEFRSDGRPVQGDEDDW